MKIDCHILTLPHEDKFLHKKCRALLKRQPVNVIESPGIVGDLKQARIDAYRKGTSELVSYVDYDDETHDGAYQACLDKMMSRPDLIGCYTKHYQVNNAPVEISIPKWNKRTFITEGFSRVFVVKRDIIEKVLDRHSDLLPKVWGQDRCILALTGLYGEWEQIDMIGYSYFQHEDSTSVRSKNQYGQERFEQNIQATKDFIEMALQSKMS